MQSRIAVVGERASVMGFRTVGFEVYEAASAAEIESTVHKLVKEQFGVVFITEQALTKAPHILEQYKDNRVPAIIPIPGRDGPLGIGMTNLRKSAERAVGADILFNE